MKNVEILAGTENIINTPFQPYNENIIEFSNELSQKLMKNPDSKKWPDVISFAFWCRKANIEKMKNLCPEFKNRLGRGLCFHIAPGNIPVNFAFTFMFGLLSGCSNIVRLPSKNFIQCEIIINALNEILKKYPEILNRTQFVRYPSSENEITKNFCSISDARLIWGGDITIKNIRSIEVKPRCIDICFADRYSICIINGKSILESDEIKIKRLTEDFYNDTYLMDQNACSSPQIIFWLNDNPEAREKFWNSVYLNAERKYNLQAAVSVDKYTHSCEDSIEHSDVLGKITKRTNLLYRAEILKLKKNMEDFRGKCGYFYEYNLSDLNEICNIINSKYQTITYFGINPEEIREFVIKNNLRGIDRIAPVGRAMDIGVIWDGFDIVRTLSRIISI